MKISRNSTADVIAAAQTLLAGLPKEGGNPFGISEVQIAAVTPTALIAAQAALQPLRAGLHTAVQSKETLRESVATGYSRAVATAYASDATDAQLASIGLPPRRAGVSTLSVAVSAYAPGASGLTVVEGGRKAA